MNTTNLKFVAAFLAAPLLVATVLFMTGRLRRDAEIEREKQHFKPLIRKWESASFEAIKPEAQFWKRFEEIPIQNSLLLSSNQRDELYVTLTNYVRAYHLGTYDAFQRFRVPVKRFKLVDSVVGFMREDFKKSNATLPVEQEALLHAYWTNYVRDKWTNFWTGVAFGESSVQIERTTSVLPPLNEFILSQTNKPHGGVSTAGPMIEFHTSPQEQLSRHGKIDYATANLLLKNRDVTYPVYCRFMWDADGNEWLPIEQASAYAGPRNYTLLF